MGVMFAEDVAFLRTQLEAAQEAVVEADAERTRMVEIASKERSRAEEAEQIAKTQAAELQQLRHELRKFAAEAARVDQLEGEVESLESQARDFRAEVERLTQNAEKDRLKLGEVRDQLSGAKAAVVSLRSELEPTRNLVEAIHLWKQAQDAIWKELR